MENSKVSFLNNISGSINKGIDKITVSAPFDKQADIRKLVIEEISSKSRKTFRISSFSANKVFHGNFDSSLKLMEKIEEIYETGYKQWDIKHFGGEYKILVNKKKGITITGFAETGEKTSQGAKTHNRPKSYILKEDEPSPFLVKLGIMNSEGFVLADKRKKFRQINKFLEILETVEKNIPENAHIIDFGCGKSYLTFAMYHYFNNILGKNLCFTGLDLKEDVVLFCNNMARELNFDRLIFRTGNISDFEYDSKVDMVVTLHACDTATDFALYFAVKNNVSNILSVPCCQHELFNQIKNTELNPLLKHGILKERFAALLTDTIRGLLLESYGYKVNIMEFIETEHTPKNIMIKAVKSQDKRNFEKLALYNAIAEGYGINPTLYRLLEENDG
jgi:SAM-dependent methyltransferase